MKYGKIILSVICLICIFVFCYIATTGKIFTLDELPLRFMTVFLSAIVTAVLTVILLSGQSNAEEIKERNVIVFKKKSKIYEKYNDRLYKVLKEQKINGNTYREIIIEYYKKLVLYLNKKSQWKITDHFMKLAECVGIEMNDRDISDVEINDNYIKLRTYIFSIISILIDDLRLGGKIYINKQNALERNTFSYFSDQILLEELDNIFAKRNDALFERATFTECEDGFFVIIQIKGNTSGGRIEIGPFPYSKKNESNDERIIFRLHAPPSNPLAEPYISSKEGNYIIFYDCDHVSECSEYYQIDLTSFKKTDLENLIKNGIEIKDIYNKNIYQFGFDENTYTRYGGFYVSICKTIAARAFYHFSNATTDKDNKSIKELCKEFGEVNSEDITHSAAEKQGIKLNVDGELM